MLTVTFFCIKTHETTSSNSQPASLTRWSVCSRPANRLARDSAIPAVRRPWDSRLVVRCSPSRVSHQHLIMSSAWLCRTALPPAFFSPSYSSSAHFWLPSRRVCCPRGRYKCHFKQNSGTWIITMHMPLLPVTSGVTKSNRAEIRRIKASRYEKPIPVQTWKVALKCLWWRGCVSSASQQQQWIDPVSWWGKKWWGIIIIHRSFSNRSLSIRHTQKKIKRRMKIANSV